MGIVTDDNENFLKLKKMDGLDESFYCILQARSRSYGIRLRGLKICNVLRLNVRKSERDNWDSKIIIFFGMGF